MPSSNRKGDCQAVSATEGADLLAYLASHPTRLGIFTARSSMSRKNGKRKKSPKVQFCDGDLVVQSDHSPIVGFHIVKCSEAPDQTIGAGIYCERCAVAYEREALNEFIAEAEYEENED